MKIKINNRIPINGKAYPLLCNNLVLCEIQEKYGSISNFERLLIGKKSKNAENETSSEYSIKVLNFAVIAMIKEGLEFENKSKTNPLPELNDNEIIRGIESSVFETIDLIHREFARCFVTKKNTPQVKKKTLREVLKSIFHG